MGVPRSSNPSSPAPSGAPGGSTADRDNGPANLSANDAPDDTGEDESQDFVTFVLEDEHFAFPMHRVREIVRLPRVVHVPLGPPSLLGLANLRGRVLPILDLRRATGFPEREPDDRTRVIVVEFGTVVGLVVDRVSSVTSVAQHDIDAADGVQATVDSDALAGIIRMADSGRIVPILDVACVLAAELRGVDAASADGPGEQAGDRGPGSRGVDDRDAAAGDRDDTLELVSFVIDDEEYALSVERVQEIVAAPTSVTAVPNAASHVLGVMDLRGRLLPVVSLRRLFGLADLPLDPNNRIVVVPVDRGAGREPAIVGIVMDSVRQVLRVPIELVHPLPEFVAPAGADTGVASVCRLDEGRRLVSVLAAERMFDARTASVLAELGSDPAAAWIDAPPDGDQPTDVTAADDTEGDAMAGNDPVGGRGATGTAEETQLVVFRLGGEEYGVAVDAVQEIIRVPERMSQVPRSLEFVEGLVNLRGTVLPVLDLRVRLGLPRVARDERQRIVVVTIAGVRTGFVVDAVTEVMKLPANVIEAAPDLADEQAGLIAQVANLAERQRMLLILESSGLLGPRDVDQLASALPDAIAA